MNTELLFEVDTLVRQSSFAWKVRPVFQFYLNSESVSAGSFAANLLLVVEENGSRVGGVLFPLVCSVLERCIPDRNLLRSCQEQAIAGFPPHSSVQGVC